MKYFKKAILIFCVNISVAIITTWNVANTMEFNGGKWNTFGAGCNQICNFYDNCSASCDYPAYFKCDLLTPYFGNCIQSVGENGTGCDTGPPGSYCPRLDCWMEGC